MIPDKLDAQYWSNRFLNHDTPWDVGRITDPLKAYIDQLTDKNISVLIPGGGNSYEAEYLLQHGFTAVTVIDIAPVLTTQLAKRLSAFAGKQLQIITGDFFEHFGSYDLILEQTFFCALAPALRTNYVKKMHALLKENGKLAGILFNRSFEGGPPFGGNQAEYELLFADYFTIKKLEACYNSIAPRAGAELFINLLRK